MKMLFFQVTFKLSSRVLMQDGGV